MMCPDSTFLQLFLFLINMPLSRQFSASIKTAVLAVIVVAISSATRIFFCLRLCVVRIRHTSRTSNDLDNFLLLEDSKYENDTCAYEIMVFSNA